MENSPGKSLSAEDRLLRARFRKHPFWLLWLLAAAFLFVLLSIPAAIFAPSIRPANYVEGTSAFNHLMPFVGLAAVAGGALIGFLGGTGASTIEYGNLSAGEFRKGFLQKLTAAEGWSMEMVSEKYLLYRNRKAQVLIDFEAEQMRVVCPLRLVGKVRGLAVQVKNAGAAAG